MPIKLLVDVPVHAEALARLEASGHYAIDVLTPPREKPSAIAPERLSGVDVLFCTQPPQNMADGDSLRWIQIASAGYTQLFGHDLEGRGIRATNALGCFDVPIAEWAMAMMVALARDLRQMLRNQDAAIWDRSAVFQREIRGLTLGLWGYGGIGRETARLAKQMGLKVHVMTRNGVGPRGNTYCVPGTGDPEGRLPDRVFRSGQELEFLAGLDFLVLALPMTKASEGMIGERELRALPPTAFLLNPARGPIVQEKALIRALKEKWIAGAALDTHYKYPMPSEHPLWKFPNVIFTPHISGSSLSPRFKDRLWDIFTLNLERYRRGEPLLNELTPAQLAGT